MTRRQFNNQLIYGLGVALPGRLACPSLFNTFCKMKKPSRLRTGDTVALITPGSPISQTKLDNSIANMKSLGLKVKYNPTILSKHGYLAGTDEQRLNDLHQFFADDNVKAIWCVRGGYGCPRLLPKIDYKLIRKNPKILIGYSDVTALLGAISEKSDLIGFHGPMTGAVFSSYALTHLKAVLMEAQENWMIDPAAFDNGQYSIHGGTAEGDLVGGNLSLLAALTGTPYLPSFKKKIVFIEDIGEKPYRIDRMLTQLRQGTDLYKAAAIVLGIFADCEAKEGDDSLSLKEVFHDRLLDLGIPVYYGFPVGHINDQCILPIGSKAIFDGATGKLVLQGRAVT